MDPGASLIVGDADCELNPCILQRAFWFRIIQYRLLASGDILSGSIVGMVLGKQVSKGQAVVCPILFFYYEPIRFPWTNKVSQTFTISKLGKSKKREIIPG
jgi:hypothetical protein